MKTETIALETMSGKANAFAALPDGGNGKAVIVVQEYWGLNDHIKDIAARYAGEGFAAFAPDLYGGKIAKDPDEASAMMGALSSEEGLAIIDACLRTAAESYGFSHFGITGYCMGGTFALRAACVVEGLSAAVPFYGDIPEEPVLKQLRVPTLFVSAIQDGWITPEKVAKLEDAAERYELPVRILKYDADHAFFNDTRPAVYDAAAAKDAWANAISFFEQHLSSRA